MRSCKTSVYIGKVSFLPSKFVRKRTFHHFKTTMYTVLYCTGFYYMLVCVSTSDISCCRFVNVDHLVAETVPL